MSKENEGKNEPIKQDQAVRDAHYHEDGVDYAGNTPTNQGSQDSASEVEDSEGQETI